MKENKTKDNQMNVKFVASHVKMAIKKINVH